METETVTPTARPFSCASLAQINAQPCTARMELPGARGTTHSLSNAGGSVSCTFCGVREPVLRQQLGAA